MNLDDLKEEVDPESEEEEDTSDAEEDLSDALTILEDCGKFIATIMLGMELSNKFMSLKKDVDTLLEDIYSFTSQYDIEETEEDGEGKPL